MFTWVVYGPVWVDVKEEVHVIHCASMRDSFPSLPLSQCNNGVEWVMYGRAVLFPVPPRAHKPTFTVLYMS